MTGFDRRGRRMRRLAVGLAVVVSSTPVSAQSPLPKPLPGAPGKPAAAAPAVPAKPAAPVPNPAIEAARPAWDALPLADRIAIQDGLVWTGDYAGSLDGTFGRMTFEAIAAFQGRHKFTPDGVPTPPAVKLLGETATAKKAAVGFQPVDDKATGVRIHLPTKLLGPAAKRDGGSRWVGREGRIQIDTFASADGDLAGLFERMKVEVPGRKVVYAVLRPDWFVVSDEAGGRHGYARFVRGAQGVRGFVFSLDASLGTELDRVVIATAGRFEPFPGAAPNPQATPATPVQPATPAVVAAPPAPAAPVVAAASGVVVASGRVLTAASAVSGCASLTVGGRPATVATADAGGIATLAVSGPTGGPMRLAGAGDGALTVLASGESGGRAGVVAVPGEAVDGRARAPLQRGALGAPVFDGSGALVGLVAGRPDEKRAVAGLVPPAAYDLVGGEGLAAAVTAAGGANDPTTAAATTTGRLVAAWAGRVVAVDCRR